MLQRHELWIFGFCYQWWGISIGLTLTFNPKFSEYGNNILSFSDSFPYVSSLVCAFFMFLTPLWIVISSKHPASRTLLYSGWEPVITAMVISRCVYYCVCVCCCVYFSVEKTARGFPQLPLSGMLDDSSLDHIAAPKHLHLQVPLSRASLLIHPSQNTWLDCLLPQSSTLATTLNENKLLLFKV